LVAIALVMMKCTVPGDPVPSDPVPEVPVPGGGSAPLVPVPSDAADQPKPAADPPADAFPKPHKKFAAHFTDPLHHDEGAEFAPFGSDEGSDTLYGWLDRLAELTTCTTVRWMITAADPGGALDDAEHNGPDVDGFIIGAGFALLLLTGHIDTEGKQLVLAALHRTYSYYADANPREPAVMIRDLARFPATDCTET
jgi:hypothetical protein